MYFSNSNASKALAILSNAGHSAEAVQASKPGTGPRFLVSVQAPHLPKLEGKIRTVQLRTPNELLGWGATQADVDTMNKREAAGVL